MADLDTIRILQRRIAELERNVTSAHNAMEALVESNAALRREVYELRNNKLTLKEQLP